MRATKVLGLLAVLVIGGSVLLTKGLQAIAPGAAQYANREIEAQSVADYCTQVIPQVCDHARESGEAVEGVKGKIAYAAFELVATGYCFYKQDRFGDARTQDEKELFGDLAGLNIKRRLGRHAA